MYLYSTSLFYFASCLFSSHPLPLQPVGTLNSCPTGSLSRTAAPGTAPLSSLPSSNTTVSPGEGKSPTQNRKLFQTYFTGFTPCGNHKSGVELLYNYVCAVHMLLSFHDLSVYHYYRLTEICFFFFFSSIVTMIKHLEKMMASYVVPVAFVNGDRYVSL